MDTLYGHKVGESLLLDLGPQKKRKPAAENAVGA